MRRVKEIAPWLVAFIVGLAATAASHAAPAVLNAEGLERHVAKFNAMEDEPIVNLVPNAAAAKWLQANIPLFECPDAEIEEIYYFRWWALRKHLRRPPEVAPGQSSPHGHVFTEFINRAEPVSSALGHHVMEGRWLHDARYHDDYVRWWLRSNGGKPHARLHHYSQWLSAALHERALVTGDRGFVVDLLDELVADYRQWETERLVVGPPLAGAPRSPVGGTATSAGPTLGGAAASAGPTSGGPTSGGTATSAGPTLGGAATSAGPTLGGAAASAGPTSDSPAGLFWQFDVRDAMEESISGSRTKKNIRPTINSYMFGNAQALAAIARWAQREEVAAEFAAKAAALRQLTQDSLWHAEHRFFEVRLEGGALANVREAIGFIPWYFKLPEPGRGYEAAWAQFADERGFRAPFGLTTAERRHPQFRTHGTGTCEWDGAVWPFATAQTLTALANVLRDYPQQVVTARDYFEAFRAYVRSHRWEGGKPYIGEYLDEKTGAWLKGDHPRSRWYHHSTFADLLIGGVVGLRPRADDTIEVHPLLPPDAWAWFCLDDVRYHGRSVTILWDREGKRYGRGAGLSVFVDGQRIAHSRELQPVTGSYAPARDALNR